MNKYTMLDLIESELNAEIGDSTNAGYAFTGVLQALVEEAALKKYISMRGWDK